MIKSKTAIGAALENSGVCPEDIEFDIAISKYLNSGATIARALERVRLASEKMPGGGQSNHASDSQEGPADAGQPVEGEEANPRMPQGQSVSASSPSSSRGGEGQAPNASKGQTGLAIPAANPAPTPPPREPSPAQRRAAAEARKRTAFGLLYVHKTSTGAWWGDVYPYEVASMQRDSIRGMALMSICGPLSKKQMHMPFSQLLKPEQTKIAFDKADAEMTDAS